MIVVSIWQGLVGNCSIPPVSRPASACSERFITHSAFASVWLKLLLAWLSIVGMWDVEMIVQAAGIGPNVFKDPGSWRKKQQLIKYPRCDAQRIRYDEV